MIVKILGTIDILAGIVIWLNALLNWIGFGSIPSNLILTLGILVLAKGLIFIIGLDIMSALDVISGLIIILASSASVPKPIISLVALFLIVKGGLSLLD